MKLTLFISCESYFNDFNCGEQLRAEERYHNRVIIAKVMGKMAKCEVDTSPVVLALPHARAQPYHLVAGWVWAGEGRVSENLVSSSCRQEAAEARQRRLKGKRYLVVFFRLFAL